jgi:hypothetical protein
MAADGVLFLIFLSSLVFTELATKGFFPVFVNVKERNIFGFEK